MTLLDGRKLLVWRFQGLGDWSGDLTWSLWVAYAWVIIPKAVGGR